MIGGSGAIVSVQDALLKGVHTLLPKLRDFLPSRRDYDIAGIKFDLLAGITVAFVALPLALGFGVTSGGGAAAGITTAIIAGFVAALFGGSRFQVSGPTGAMTAVLLPIVMKHGPSALPILGIGAGIILIALSFLGLGRFIRVIPWPVVSGFTNGIGIIILLQQLPNFFGVAQPQGESIVLLSWETVQTWLAAPGFAAPILALLTIAIMLGWGAIKQLHLVPGSMAALVIGTLLSFLPPFQGIERIGAIPQAIGLPKMPTMIFSDGMIDLARAALAVAVLAALESLLSAVVADGMSGTDERHDPNRELFGQGLANIASGFFGGLPATAALARTAVNVRSGARSRMASMIHAVFLLIVILFLAPLAAQIPLAVLAGILMIVAVRMIERHAARLIFRSTKSDMFVLIITMVVTVLFDLILAIEVGLIAAAVLFIVRMSSTFEVADIAEEDTEAAQELRDDPRLARKVLAFRVDGPIFFGAAPRFIDRLLTVDSDIHVVILVMKPVPVMDATGATALQNLHDRLTRAGIVVMFAGLQPQPLQLLKRMRLLDTLTFNGQYLFATSSEAIAASRELLHEEPAADTESGNDEALVG